MFGVVGQTNAQVNHDISVDVDDATTGDVQLIEDSLSGAADGAAVPRSLRGIIMGSLGEVLPAVNARIDENDMLTLDDGSTVALLDDDTISVRIKKRIFGPVFACMTKKKATGMQGGCQPECVRLPNGNVVNIPPSSVTKFCKGIIIIPK